MSISLNDFFSPITFSIMPSSFNPVFLDIKIVQADVVRHAAITAHPVEKDINATQASATISDNRVVMPREVQLDVICPSESANRALLDAFDASELFTIKTKNEIVTNCAFAEAPYSNSAEMTNATRYRLRFIEVFIVQPASGQISAADTNNKSSVSTTKRGQVSTSTARPTVAQELQQRLAAS